MRRRRYKILTRYFRPGNLDDDDEEETAGGSTSSDDDEEEDDDYIERFFDDILGGKYPKVCVSGYIN